MANLFTFHWAITFLQQPTVNILNVQERELCNQLPEELHCPSSDQRRTVYSYFSLGIWGLLFSSFLNSCLSGRTCTQMKEVKRDISLNFKVQIKITKFSCGYFFWFPLFFCINEPRHSQECSFGLPKYGSLNLAHLNLNKWVWVAAQLSPFVLLGFTEGMSLIIQWSSLLSLLRVNRCKSMGVFRNPTVFLVRFLCQGS